MLEQVLRHIHNRFEYAYLGGTFTVSSGTFEVDGAQDGQYLWIEGSVFNEGLHEYPLSDLVDETFDGRVVLLAVPRAVVELSESIASWVADNSKALDSPYQSESFGGYSYSKGGGSSSEGGPATVSGWRAHFADDLAPWRKMSHSGW